jgi:hypothetical protein
MGSGVHPFTLLFLLTSVKVDDIEKENDLL